ncbi:MAG: phenylalanine--tRNA ligase beta subunit-related protein, partial [Vulcanimicrobiaceae bacterium]
MRLPLAWLRDYLACELGSDALAERLVMLGFPVESIERRPPLRGVVAGRLREVVPHPNADRLRVCTVDIGAAKSLTIATAADNVAAGDLVPVATLGAELAGGLAIGARTMRGIASEGMLVSIEELGLAAAGFENGILHLDEDLPLGCDLVSHYRLNDDVLEVEIGANRVDAMSVLGLARELAAALGLPLRMPETWEAADARALNSDALVRLESADCRRFVAQRFGGIVVRPAPLGLRLRLALAGQRPLDGVVDVTNFVMLECAQPLHAYDLAQIAGGRVVVRDARAGERLRTLDGEERALDPSVLAIADDDGPLAIAGIVGGERSSVG